MARERRYRFQLRVEGEDRSPVCVARGRSKEKAKRKARAYFRHAYQHLLKGTEGAGYDIVRVPDRPPRARRI